MPKFPNFPKFPKNSPNFEISTRPNGPKPGRPPLRLCSPCVHMFPGFATSARWWGAWSFQERPARNPFTRILRPWGRGLAGRVGRREAPWLSFSCHRLRMSMTGGCTDMRACGPTHKSAGVTHSQHAVAYWPERVLFPAFFTVDAAMGRLPKHPSANSKRPSSALANFSGRDAGAARGHPFGRPPRGIGLKA